MLYEKIKGTNRKNKNETAEIIIFFLPFFNIKLLRRLKINMLTDRIQREPPNTPVNSYH